jgi:O-antigen ligase
MGVFLLASSEKCRGRWPVVMMTMMGVINIYMGARNRGGVCLAAALYVLETDILRRRSRASSRLKSRSLVLIAASIVVGLSGVLWAYQYAAGAGILGDKAKDEYEEQSSGDYGVLIGGRTEMLGSLPAIYDSPILGHGSWARDPIYLIAERQALAVMGYVDATDFDPDQLVEGYIPTHSYLFGAWVNAGIVGALFWAWVFVFIARALMRIYPPTVFLLPIMAFFVFSLLWDILFSPYGATTRIVVTYYFVVLATCFSMVPSKTVVVTAGGTKLRIDSPIAHRP